jgi:hypothetical protein
MLLLNEQLSEASPIMRKLGIEPFHWIKLYNLIYDYLFVPQPKLYVQYDYHVRLIPDFLYSS